MGLAAKRRIKEFFKNKTESDESVEILRMFILPFVSKYKGWGLSIDVIISAFFSSNTRHIFYARAKRNFRMPGAKWRKSGGYPIYGIGNREVAKGAVMLVVHDERDGQAKIEVKIQNETSHFLLSSPEFATVKDWIEVINDSSSGHRDDRTKPMEGSDNSDRNL